MTGLGFLSFGVNASVNELAFAVYFHLTFLMRHGKHRGSTGNAVLADLGFRIFFFIEIAYGSLLESYCQFQIATDLEYIKQDDLDKIQLHIDKIANKLSALKRSYSIT